MDMSVFPQGALENLAKVQKQLAKAGVSWVDTNLEDYCYLAQALGEILDRRYNRWNTPAVPIEPYPIQAKFLKNEHWSILSYARWMVEEYEKDNRRAGNWFSFGMVMMSIGIAEDDLKTCLVDLLSMGLIAQVSQSRFILTCVGMVHYEKEMMRFYGSGAGYVYLEKNDPQWHFVFMDNPRRLCQTDETISYLQGNNEPT